MDNETKSIINKIYKDEKIFIDPHTAVGVGVIKKISLEGNTIALATAHPSKFSDVVNKETNVMPELPQNLSTYKLVEEFLAVRRVEIELARNYNVFALSGGPEGLHFGGQI